MADKEPKKEERQAERAPASKDPNAAGDAQEVKKGGLLKSTPAQLGIVMVLEAAVLFAGFKFLGAGPSSSPAVEPAGEAASAEAPAGHGEASGEHGATAAKPVDPKHVVEVPVLNFKAPNKLSGATYLYEVEVVITTKAANKEKAVAAVQDRSATIKDRVRTIVSQSDPAKLGGGQEPGLETLRRQIKFQLDEILGEGIIDEVLIPRCIPYRTDS
jgi:flagellar basal body-associated protein FliL